MWAMVRKKIYLEASTPLFDQVLLGCIQREATIHEYSIKAKKTFFLKHNDHIQWRCHTECRAIEVIEQDLSSEVVALFLEDWELGRVALNCHMAMDLLCQEVRDACWVISGSLGSVLSL